jgi:hypothetical protein
MFFFLLPLLAARAFLFLLAAVFSMEYVVVGVESVEIAFYS